MDVTDWPADEVVEQPDGSCVVTGYVMIGGRPRKVVTVYRVMNCGNTLGSGVVKRDGNELVAYWRQT